MTSKDAILGAYPDSNGEATVSGAGSQWISSDVLRVGALGEGILRVEGGGHVTAGTLYASLTDFHGDGTITATNGAVVDGDLHFDATHGTQSVHSFGSGGVLSVTADGGEIGAGYKGTGSLTIADGVVVNSSYGYLGFSSGSIGQANVSGAGSQWTNEVGLSVGGDGGGVLTISNGGLVRTSELIIDEDLNGDGLVNLATGGMLAIASYQYAENSLADFLALVGGTKAIRYWDDALAGWADITAATYGDDYTLEHFTSGDLAGYTLLTVGQAPALPGDYNADGVVDAADYTVWRDHLGQSVTLPNQATPGEVTEYDRDVWAANFGATLTADVIPEPSAVVLVTLAAALGAWRVARQSNPARQR